MTDFATADYFSDQEIAQEPYAYLDYLREQNPVFQEPKYHVYAVTGYDEASEVYRHTEAFSSCNSVIGPFATFPVPLEGDDVSAIIERYRDQLPMHEHMVTMDPPAHTRERAILMKLLTPRRLEENEAFMRGLARRQLAEFVADGRCELRAVRVGRRVELDLHVDERAVEGDLLHHLERFEVA